MGTMRQEAERAVKAQSAICAGRERRVDDAIDEMHALRTEVSAFSNEIRTSHTTILAMLKRHDQTLYGAGPGDIGLAGSMIEMRQIQGGARKAAAAMLMLGVLTLAGWLTALGIWIARGGRP